MKCVIETMKYVKGDENSREAVHIDVMFEDGSPDTVIANFDCCLDTYIHTAEKENRRYVFSLPQRIEILEFIKAERQKLIDMYTPKTYKGWRSTHLNFDDYCFPGDIVDDEIVDYFVDCLPPKMLRGSCTQCGEPYGTGEDENGVFGNTYITFSKHDRRWVFDGYCLAGKNENKEHRGTRLDRELNKLKSVPKSLLLTFLGVDSHNRYVYSDERGQLWKHLDCNSSMEECQKRGDRLYSSINNAFDGEPDCPMREGIEVEYTGGAV